MASLLPHFPLGARRTRQPNPDSSTKAGQKTIALYRSDPSQGRYGTVPTSFTTLAELTARGPFAPIFIPAQQPDHFTDWLDNTLAR